MLSLKFCKTVFDSHLTHRFGSSDANAFRTFDREIPNCFAIGDSVMPALNDRSVGSGSTTSACRERYQSAINRNVFERRHAFAGGAP